MKVTWKLTEVFFQLLVGLILFQNKNFKMRRDEMLCIYKIFTFSWRIFIMAVSLLKC